MRSSSYWPAFALVSAACVLVSGVPLIAAALHIIGERSALPGLGDRQITLLVNSLRIAGGAAVVSMVLGGALGMALQMLRVPSRTMLLWLLPVPFLIPPYIQTLAWMEILGKGGLLAGALESLFDVRAVVPNLYSPGARYGYWRSRIILSSPLRPCLGSADLTRATKRLRFSRGARGRCF